MKKYKVIAKVSGITMVTILFAENSNFAFKLAQQQFGASNVVSPPMEIH